MRLPKKWNQILFKLYQRLPYPIQALLFKIKAREKSQSRLKGNFEKLLKRYIDLWHADYKKVKEYQRSELVSLLLRAMEHTKWYAAKYGEHNITVELIRRDPYEALNLLPILEKDDIRSDLEAISVFNDSKEKPIVNYTSGTTGSPMKSYTNAASEQRLHAIKKRFQYSAGIPLKSTGVRFSGNQIISLSRKKPPFWHHNPYENVWFFSLYHLNKATLPQYIKKLNEIKPDMMDGYPSGIHVLASYINNNSIQLDFKPKAICTTAEPLSLHVRRDIESAFKCKVYNQYSTSEGALFITECELGNLHINEDTGVAEFLNADGETGNEGELCELIATSFINQKTPLIRYRTGDWFNLGDPNKKCDCGCQMPIVDSILGRVEDYLVDENGIEQGMVSYRTFKMANNIIKAQIIQTAIDSVTLKIVRDDEYSKTDEKYLQSKIEQVLGKSLNVTFNYCEDIETGPNGKFKSVIRDF